MNSGSNHPSGGGPSGPGGRGRGRKGRRPQQHGKKGGPGNRGKNQQNSRTGGGIYTAPMDHSYRNGQQQGGQGGGRFRGRGGRGGYTGTQYLQPEPEPLPVRSEPAVTKIFAFIDDLFFLAKIQEISRKLNIKVDFVKTEQDILDRVGQNGDQKPALVIIDLNNNSIKPISLIGKLKSKLKKTSVIGFLSHVQGDLKMKAQEAGCDMVLPRSAFSQNLPSLLRRHAVDEEEGIQ